MGQASPSFHEIFVGDARMPCCEPMPRSKARAFVSLFLMRPRGSRLGIGSAIRIFLPPRCGSNRSRTPRRRSCGADGRRYSSGAGAWTSLMHSGGIDCEFRVRNFGMLRSFLQALFRTSANKSLWRVWKDCRTPLVISTTSWSMKSYQSGSLKETTGARRGARVAQERRSRLAVYPDVRRLVLNLC